MPERTRPTADVSVIMPAYNAAATIERAILSASRQTLRPREIIICDDGSGDGTPDLVRSLGAVIDGVPLRLMTQSNKGAGSARNHAISQASSEWLAFLDADDEWLESKLEASFDILGQSNHVLVAHNFIQVSGDGTERVVDSALRFRTHGAGFQGLYRYGFISTSTVVVKRDAVLKAGGFDESLETGQDFDLWLRILRPETASYHVFDAALLRYTVNPAGITSQTRRRLDCTLRIAQRHQPGLTSLLFRIAAVHYEAFNAYRHSRRYGKALWVCLLMAGRLLVALPEAVIPESGRSRFGKWVLPVLWGWLFVAFAAYLYRFNHLVVAFYKLVSSL